MINNKRIVKRVMQNAAGCSANTAGFALLSVRTGKGLGAYSLGVTEQFPSMTCKTDFENRGFSIVE